MKEKIIKTTIQLIQTKGIGFTMDDIAAIGKISKKTIYKYFESKDVLLRTVVDYLFDDIHRQHLIILNQDLPNAEKLRRIVCVYPEALRLDSLNLDKLLEHHPEIHSRIDYQFHNNWELTLELYDRCVKEGSIRDIDRKYFRMILLGIFNQSIHAENQEQATIACVDAIFDGFLNSKECQH
ncbi:MAG: TetR/AcrR family transcriptional regulator [Acutalibacteraceae bacterium]